MRPYSIDQRRPRYFKVPLRWGPAVIRPNRTSAGMSATYDRSGKTGQSIIGEPVLKLLVKGTTDELAPLFLFTTPKPCPCCGHKSGKLQLNDSGRARLRRAQHRKG